MQDTPPPIIWNKKIPNSNLEKFKKLVQKKYNQHFESYWDFHQWSIKHVSNFWRELWHYFDILHSKPYDKVYEKTGPGFMDCEWFSGAKFNFAKNVLRVRDDSTAIISVDENGFEEAVTFHEMYEEVKLYASALKKNGLQKGDVVACYMSNRKESVYVFLAALSVGAIFGGPQPYTNSKVAAKYLNSLEAKFLFAIDYHSLNGFEYHNIDNLPDIADNVPSLEKVIVVPTKAETCSRDISNIKNGCLLPDFLGSGRTEPDGAVPDLEFEQLPFDHPICVHFTSGTSGNPKGAVHAAGTILTMLCDIVFCLNFEKGDVYYSDNPVGWQVWIFCMPCLARGVTILLYSGSPTYERPGSNIWDIFSKFKVTSAFLLPHEIDILEKNNIVPKSQTNLDYLKILGIGGSPPKVQNFLFVRNKIKEDLYVANKYGTTEVLCEMSGADFNSPLYAGELQVPCLGMDLRCFDKQGNSVVNQKGELVVATPSPALPIYLWGDSDNRILKEEYLSKYPGVWWQGDEMWINPVTRGFVVNGRTDDTIKQKSERFLASDIYSAIHDMEEIADCICVGQRREDGDSRAVLFLKMNTGYSFTKELKNKVEQKIKEELSNSFIPELILDIKDIPYNLNNKKMESTVRKILATNQVPDVDNIRNPECLKYYCDIPDIVNY